MRSTHRAAHKILAAVLVVGLPFGAAYAQSSDLDMRSVSNRLDRIENEISDLQRQSYGGGASTGAPRALDGGRLRPTSIPALSSWKSRCGP